MYAAHRGLRRESNTRMFRVAGSSRLGFARRSAVEVQSLLYAAFDINYINEAQLKEHYEQARKTKALIGGFKHSLKKQT